MSSLFTDTIRKTGGTLGTDIRIKNTSVYESDGGTSVTQNLVQGLAKLWVNFQGDASSISPRDSLNVGSLTDNGTGNYTVTYSNNMGNTNYSGSHTGNAEATIGGVGVYSGINNISSTSSCNPTLRRDNANADCDPVLVQLFGDLA